MRKAQRRPALVGLYLAFLDDADRCAFILRVAGSYDEPALQRIFQEGDRSSRRAAVLALGSLGTTRSRDLFAEALHDTDRAVRLLAEDGLRTLWVRSAGTGPMRVASAARRLNLGRLYDRAVDILEELLQEVPDFGEAWFQLGIACQGVRDWERAGWAFEQCLRCEPLHFPASLQLSRVLLQQQQPWHSMQQLCATLDIYPDLEAARMQLERLRRTLPR